MFFVCCGFWKRTFIPMVQLWNRRRYFPYQYIPSLWKIYMVAVFTDYGSCPDQHPVHAPCSERLVKMVENLVKNEKEKRIKKFAGNV